MNIESGNAAHDGIPFNSWFVGDLKKWATLRGSNAGNGSQLRQSGRVEMKWAHHCAGECRTDWAACAEVMTMSVLVRGKFLLRFRSPTRRSEVTERRLECEGDYAIWGTDVEHNWVVEADAVIFTVRWRER